MGQFSFDDAFDAAAAVLGIAQLGYDVVTGNEEQVFYDSIGESTGTSPLAREGYYRRHRNTGYGDKTMPPAPPS